MSRLGEALRLVEMGALAPRYKPVPSAQISTRWDTSPNIMAKRYELRVHLSRCVDLPDLTAITTRSDRLMAADVVQQVRITMLNEVFGEFTGPIRRAMIANNNGDTRRCQLLLGAVLQALTDSKPFTEPNDNDL